MASVKVVIRKNKMKKDGTCPLAIRIIKDRKTRFIFTGYYVLEKDWNADLCKVKKTHPNAVRLNNFLMKKVVEATDTTLDVENSNEEYSAKEIKQRIKKTKSKISFFQLAWKRIENYKAKGTYTVADSERSIINNINKFMNGKALFFEDIDQAFINEFKVFCSASLGQKTRTMTNQLIFIRTLFNQAIKEGIVQAKYYPFGGGDKEKIRIGSGLKIGLTKDEVEKIENVELKEGSPLWHTRNVWLTSFYFAGIRVADVLKLKWSDFQDGRLFYVMDKNEKPVSLKIPKKAQVILERYESRKNAKKVFLFHYMDDVDLDDSHAVFKKIASASSLLNTYLKKIAQACEIDKNLSNHIARHTFGNIAGDTIHPLMLQKLYRHSDLKTTINYQANFIHKEADEALDSVIGD